MTHAIVFLGDSCVSIQLGASIDPIVNARGIAVAGALEALGLPGVRDVVPTYNAVTVHFDPAELERDVICNELLRLASAPQTDNGEQGRIIEVPVTYGGEAGPDLGAVAEFARCTESEVVRFHGDTTYRVYMLGFLPGFAYMGMVPPRIAAPRLDTPRLRVRAGSVGIAESQTGIYPVDSPGGWRIIGQTSVPVCDFTRPDPFLFRAGDRVRFVACRVSFVAT